MKYVRAFINFIFIPPFVALVIVLMAIEIFDYLKYTWRNFGDKWFWEWLG